MRTHGRTDTYKNNQKDMYVIYIYVCMYVYIYIYRYVSIHILSPFNPFASFATTKSPAGDVVLDPMCGKGTLLAEASIWWPEGRYIGCAARH